MGRVPFSTAVADKAWGYLGGRSGQLEGDYSVAGASGLLTGLAANGEIFHLRNPDANILIAVERVILLAELLTVYTGAQENYAELVRATGWSVDGTGGTALAGTKQVPASSSMPASVVASGNARLATTAALGVGTKAIDAVSMGTGPLYSGNVAFTAGSALIWDGVSNEEQPLVILGQNEGIVLRQPVAMGAAGVHRVPVRVDYREF